MIKEDQQLLRFKLRAISMVGVYLIIGTLLPSCVEKELSIKLPDLDGNSLAILSVMDNGRSPAVIVSRVEPLDDEAVFYPITQASVVLFENDVPIDTLLYLQKQLQDIDPLDKSIYYSDEVLNFLEGSSYHVVVEAEGYKRAVSEQITYRRLIATDVSLEKVVTDSIDEFGPIGNVTLTFKTLLDTSEGEMLVLDRSEDIRTRYDENLYTEEQIINGLRLSRVNDSPFLINQYRPITGINLPQGTYQGEYKDIYLKLSGQRLNLSVTHYSPHYLTFAEAFSKQDRESVGGLGTLAQRLPSNIEGGFGYFTIRDNQTVFFE